MGRRLQKLLLHNIAVYAAHTNLDSAWGGVNDILAEAIGLTEIEPLMINQTADNPSLGRLGLLASPLTAKKFAQQIKQSLPTAYVRLVANSDKLIRKVAIVSGSGAEFIDQAVFRGAEAYVTGDVRYHDAQRAAERGLTLIDAGHFGTEYPIVNILRKKLAIELSKYDKNIEVLADTEATDFFTII